MKLNNQRTDPSSPWPSRLLGLCFLVLACISRADDINLSPLSTIDNNYFIKQRQTLDSLGREHFGTRLRGNRSDLELLQRLLDKGHISRFDKDLHNAFGIALGDIYVAEKGWHWQEYRDKAGRSRAVCIPQTQHCVFPLSMLNRRLRVTTDLKMVDIYQRGLDFLSQVEPKVPYSQPKPLPDVLKGEKLPPGSRVIPF